MSSLSPEDTATNDAQPFHREGRPKASAFVRPSCQTLGVTYHTTVMTKDVGYNTGLAAEFYVLSVLHRKGLSASMTLGNRKAIDIVVEAPDRTITIDVKGMASRTNWPLDNFSSEKRENHYIALVTFNNKIRDHSVRPTVYLVPAADIPRFFYVNPKGNRRTIQFSRMRDHGSQYLEAWSAFEVQASKPAAKVQGARGAR